MSKSFLAVLVAVLGALLIASNYLLLAALKRQGRALDMVYEIAKQQGGYVFFPHLAESK